LCSCVSAIMAARPVAAEDKVPQWQLAYSGARGLPLGVRPPQLFRPEPMLPVRAVAGAFNGDGEHGELMLQPWRYLWADELLMVGSKRFVVRKAHKMNSRGPAPSTVEKETQIRMQKRGGDRIRYLATMATRWPKLLLRVREMEKARCWALDEHDRKKAQRARTVASRQAKRRRMEAAAAAAAAAADADNLLAIDEDGDSHEDEDGDSHEDEDEDAAEKLVISDENDIC